jgi:hypothetical protein
MSTGAEILARRERAAGNVSFLPPVENPGRRKVQDALDVIAGEIARLQRLQKAEDQRRAARAETAAFVEQAQRKAAIREAKRHLMITIDREFFYEIGQLALRAVRSEAHTALHAELTRLWEREE